MDPSGLAATSPKARGGIYKKLLSPCFRETSNEVAERVSLHVKPFGLETWLRSLNKTPLPQAVPLAAPLFKLLRHIASLVPPPL